MPRKKDLDKPRKVRTTIEELEVLARLKETVEWAIVKRIAQRYLTNLTKISFNLNESDPNFRNYYARLAGEAMGIKKLIKIVERAGKRLEEKEKK